jgi:hypothetical protein
LSSEVSGTAVLRDDRLKHAAMERAGSMLLRCNSFLNSFDLSSRQQQLGSPSIQQLCSSAQEISSSSNNAP